MRDSKKDFVFWNGEQWVRGKKNTRYYEAAYNADLIAETVPDYFLDMGKRVPVSRIGRGSIYADLARKENPAPRHDAEIEAAAKLQADFSGHEPANVDTLSVPEPAKVYTPVGKLAGVLYDTTRDGKPEKYIHRFRRKSRPLLLTSHDGTELRIAGGRFRFTEAGIVDE